MKKQSVLTPQARVGFPLILTLVAVCQVAAQSETSPETRRQSVTPVVFQAAGPTAASIQSTVDAFRAALGEPNNANDPGPLDEGRREINWDGGGADATTTPPVTPFNVFLNTRGAQFTTKGEGLSQAPPMGGEDGGLADLLDNSSYRDIFTAFSPLRLFIPVGSNVTKGKFFLPGTNGAVPATVTAFGAVFTDVDRQDGGGDKHSRHRGANTVIEYFAANGRLLFRGVVPASPGDKSLSFFGIVFEDALIAKIRITTGNSAPGPDDDNRRDIVMMDDFIYGEPQSEGDDMNVSTTDETADSTAAEDENVTAVAEESTTSAAPQSQALTVINGSASGNTPGTVVTVTANDPPTGQQFAGWTGDVEILANPDLSPTTATVTSTPVTITATYEPSATQP
jgi:Divergent InlB B-repeat domain